MHKKVRLRAHDFELKRFAVRRNQFMGVNYYGDISHLEPESNKRDVEIIEEDINDYYEDEFAEGQEAAASLLNSNNHTNSNKQKFVFDDEDSCSSVLFY